MTHNTHDYEEPPFALMGQNRPQHLLLGAPREKLESCREGQPSVDAREMRSCSINSEYPSTESSPPKLSRSFRSDDQSHTTATSIGSSTVWSTSSEVHRNNMGPASSSMFSIGDSIPSLVPTLGGSSHLPHSAVFQYSPQGLDCRAIPTEINTGNQGFQSSYENNSNFLSSPKMPVVHEDDDEDGSSHDGIEGMLIVSEGPDDDNWVPIEKAASATSSWRKSSPLLTTPRRPPSNYALARTCLMVKSYIIDHCTLEVSVTLDRPASVNDVMRVVGNPNLLQNWLEPVRSLIVTSISGEEVGVDSFSSGNTATTQSREYEGKWIKAVLPMGVLAPAPSSSATSYWHAAKNAMRQTLGVPSSGQLSMFVEGKRHRASFTLGPFPGDMFATHSLSVHEDGHGHVCVLSRVRLKHGEDGDMLSNYSSSHVWGSLKRCWLPSVGDYAEQARFSMARLSVLVHEGVTA
jgi:hypothetical protein